MLGEGLIWKRHADQIIHSVPANSDNFKVVTENMRIPNPPTPIDSDNNDDNMFSDKNFDVHQESQLVSKDVESSIPAIAQAPPSVIVSSSPSVAIAKSPSVNNEPMLRRSQRTVKPPQRLDL